MRADQVQQKRWSKKTILFENAEYSVIAGTYRGDLSTRHALGERWNGPDDKALGFPSVGKYPIWHIVPEFLEIPILHGLLEELARHPQSEDRKPSILLELARRQRQ